MAFYFSPLTMYQRLFSNNYQPVWNEKLKKHEYPDLVDTNELIEIKRTYQTELRRYVGFGAVLQFIPWTKAYKSRRAFTDQLETLLVTARCQLNSNKVLFWQTEKKARSSSLKRYVDFGEVYRVLNRIKSGFGFSMISRFNKESPLSLFAKSPIISDLFYSTKQWIEAKNEYKYQLESRETPLLNLMHSVVNPFRLVSALLNTVHDTLDRLLEFGNSQHAYQSNFLVRFLKAIVGLVFGIVKMPFIMLENIVDLGLRIVRAVVVNPIEHILSSVKQLFEKSPPEIIPNTKKEQFVHINVINGGTITYHVKDDTTVLELIQQMYVSGTDIPLNIQLSLNGKILDRSAIVMDCGLDERSALSEVATIPLEPAPAPLENRSVKVNRSAGVVETFTVNQDTTVADLLKTMYEDEGAVPDDVMLIAQGGVLASDQKIVALKGAQIVENFMCETLQTLNVQRADKKHPDIYTVRLNGTVQDLLEVMYANRKIPENIILIQQSGALEPSDKIALLDKDATIIETRTADPKPQQRPKSPGSFSMLHQRVVDKDTNGSTRAVLQPER